MSEITTTAKTPDALYGQYYFRTGCGREYKRDDEWLKFFASIAARISEWLQPNSVLDAGCAMGFLVEGLRKRGIEASGIDISEYAIGQVHPDIQPYCRVGSVTEPHEERYDLITCIEVLEHLPKADAELAIARFCEASDSILFSSTPTDFREATHFNVQPPEYWAEQFARHGFYRNLEFDASFVTAWSGLFQKRACSQVSIVGGYERRLWHLMQENKGLRETAVEQRQRLDFEENRFQETTQWLQDHRNMRQEFEEQLALRDQNSTSERNLRAQAEQEACLQQQRAAQAEQEVCLLQQRAEKASAQAALQHQDLKELCEKLAARKLQLEEDISNERVLRVQVEQEAERRRQDCSAWYDSELNALRQASDAKQRQLAAELASLNLERTEPAWIMFLRLRSLCEKLAPAHTRRERCLKMVARGLRLGKREGILAKVRREGGKAPQYIARKLKSLRARPPEVAPPPEAAPPLEAAPPPEVAPPQAESPTQPPNIPRDEAYERWIAANEPTASDLAKQQEQSLRFEHQPLVSVLVPIYNTPPELLRDAIESLRAQTYSKWELCLADGNSTNPETRRTLEEYAALDPRVRVKFLITNDGISENTNAALEMAQGDFVGLLDHDDTLAPFALYEVVARLNLEPDLDFLYSDKDMLAEDGSRRFWPLFKPTWSPDMMLSANYLTHLCVARTTLARRIGGFRKDTDGAQDWDFFLRIVEQSNRIAHIPKVLYHWRLWSNSTASGIAAKPYALDAQVRALEEHFARFGRRGRVVRSTDGELRIERAVEPRPSVSFIVATQSISGRLPMIIESLTKVPYAEKQEILVAHHGKLTAGMQHYYHSLNSSGVRVFVAQPGEGRPAAQNMAARAASGDVLLFLEDVVEPATRSSVDDLLVWLDQPGVAVVGGRVMNAENMHASGGLVLGLRESAGVLFAGKPEGTYTALGHSEWYRNVSAVGSACLAIRRVVFLAQGGFDEGFQHSGGEVRLCRQLTAQGRRIVYTPHARFRMRRNSEPLFELAREGQAQLEAFRDLPLGQCDPYFNVNLSRQTTTPVLRMPDEGIAERPDEPVFSLGERVMALRSGPGVKPDPSTDVTRMWAASLDFSPQEIAVDRQLQNAQQGPLDIRTVNWFIPDFHNAFYGGIYTILRLASHLHLNHGVYNRFCIVGHGPVETIGAAIFQAYPELHDQPIQLVRNDLEMAKVPPADACVATLWTTAYSVLKFKKTKRKFYMVQDCEPLFYPAGSTSGQVEATYRFGFYGLCNTQSLKQIYERDYGGVAVSFAPQVDTTIFHQPQRPRNFSSRPYRVFFYGRPNNPRNAFELGAQALRRLKCQLGDAVQIYAAGEKWQPADFDLQGIVENLGVLTIEQTAELYRECDVGLVLMFTRHPSYLPFEFMASGCLVVTNVNHASGWLLKDEQNCLLAEASAACIAAAIERGLENPQLRERITREAATMITEDYSDWYTPLEQVYAFMRDPRKHAGALTVGGTELRKAG